jgi:hypothetical protein
MNTTPHNNEIPEFDAQALLASPTLAGRLTEEEFRDFTADSELLEDAIRETPVVLSISWSTDSPGGSGSLCVHRWHGLYFLDSLDWGLEGPAPSLEAIIADERFREPCPSPEVSSDELEHHQLLRLAAGLIPADERCVRVNGQPYWREEGGGLRVT